MFEFQKNYFQLNVCSVLFFSVAAQDNISYSLYISNKTANKDDATFNCTTKGGILGVFNSSSRLQMIENILQITPDIQPLCYLFGFTRDGWIDGSDFSASNFEALWLSQLERSGHNCSCLNVTNQTNMTSTVYFDTIDCSMSTLYICLISVVNIIKNTTMSSVVLTSTETTLNANTISNTEEISNYSTKMLLNSTKEDNSPSLYPLSSTIEKVSTNLAILIISDETKDPRFTGNLPQTSARNTGGLNYFITDSNALKNIGIVLAVLFVLFVLLVATGYHFTKRKRYKVVDGERVNKKAVDDALATVVSAHNNSTAPATTYTTVATYQDATSQPEASNNYEVSSSYQYQ